VNDNSDNSNSDESKPDIVWCADGIGEVINRSARQTHHLLKTGAIKCAIKKGGLWSASRRALQREWEAA
jgi:hypothetical protein